jgi:hypothetical protein
MNRAENPLDTAFVMGSIHRVLKAEKILERDGIEVDTLVTPREIRADCGMVLLLAQADRSRSARALGAAGVPPEEVWFLRNGTWTSGPETLTEEER